MTKDHIKSGHTFRGNKYLRINFIYTDMKTLMISWYDFLKRKICSFTGTLKTPKEDTRIMYSGKGESMGAVSEIFETLGCGSGSGMGAGRCTLQLICKLDQGMGSGAGEPFGWSRGWGEDDVPWTN